MQNIQWIRPPANTIIVVIAVVAVIAARRQHGRGTGDRDGDKDKRSTKANIIRAKRRAIKLINKWPL